DNLLAFINKTYLHAAGPKAKPYKVEAPELEEPQQKVKVAATKPARVRQPLAKATSGHHAKTHHLQLSLRLACTPAVAVAASSCRRAAARRCPGGRLRPTHRRAGGWRPCSRPSSLGFCPDLAELESVVSPVRLRLMHRAEAKDGEVDISEGDSGEWRELPAAQPSADDTFLTVEVETTGVYLALLSPVKEPVRVTPEGGHHATPAGPSGVTAGAEERLHGAGRIDFSIIPFSPDRMSLVRELHRSRDGRTSPRCPPMYSLDYDGPPCRRGLTVKLPLPDWMRGAERREILDRLAHYEPAAARDRLGRPGRQEVLRAAHPQVHQLRVPPAARFCLLEAASPSPASCCCLPLLSGRRWALGARAWRQLARGTAAAAAAIRNRCHQRRCGVAPGWREEPAEAVGSPGGYAGMRRRCAARRRESATHRQRRQRQRQSSKRCATRRVGGRELRATAPPVTLQMSGDFRLRHLGESRAREEVCVQFSPALRRPDGACSRSCRPRTATITSDFYDYLLELAADSGEPLDNDEKLVDLAGRETLTFKRDHPLSGSGEQLSNHEFTIGFRDLKAYLDLKPPPAPEEPSDGEAAVAATQTTQNAKPAEQRRGLVQTGRESQGAEPLVLCSTWSGRLSGKRRRADLADGALRRLRSLGDALDGLGRRRLAGLLRRCHAARSAKLTAERLAARGQTRED
uniref:PIH1_CS domain-containing protein n=1 Tax=Macrostomum lignano TaxID=282301 RepID=A0A1I8FBC8_9PLAT